MGLFSSSPESALEQRVIELERRVRELEVQVAQQRKAAENSSISYPTSANPPSATPPAPLAPGGVTVSAEVRQLVAARKKIEAIKVLREQTGLGLKEAKDVVDRL